MENSTIRIIECLHRVGVKNDVDSFTKLFGNGAVLDSLGFIAFLSEIEREFGVNLTGAAILSVPTNVFDTVESLSMYLGGNKQKPLKKLLIVDADNTLWKGELAEAGLHGLYLNKPLLSLLGKLYSKGILLAVCSHNDQKGLCDAFAWTGTQLQFVEIIGTWETKDIAVKGILKRLNLFPESAVFMDDSPLERALVSERAGVESPVWEWDDYSNIEKLFDTSRSMTEEDKRRTQMYLEEKDRRKSQEGVSYAEWLKSIDQSIIIVFASKKEMARCKELNERANQFNMTKAFDESWNIFYASVKDKFGDLGIVGWFAIEGNTVMNFVLSCRAFGRGIEEEALKSIEYDYPNVKFLIVNTGHNAKAQEFYASLPSCRHSD